MAVSNLLAALIGIILGAIVSIIVIYTFEKTSLIK